MISVRKILAASFILALPSVSPAQTIRTVSTDVTLNEDGSADIVQRWDVTVSSGTEWYLPVSNLGDMELSGFGVSENGVDFIYEGTDWDVDRSLGEKAGRCGIVRTGKGLELCWGQGSYGNHVWVCRYHLSGLVKSLRDYDAFNHQFVNEGLPSVPQKADISFRNATGSGEWTYDNTRVWGFGFEGEAEISDGVIRASSRGGFRSMIMMVRFDKGIFSPALSLDIPFQKMQDKAFRKSSYKNDDDGEFIFMIVMILCVLLFFGFIVWIIICKLTGHIYRKGLFGVSKIDSWFRDVPLGGDLPSVWYVYSKAFRFKSVSPENLIGVFFLKWILNKYVRVIKSSEGKNRVSLVFDERTPSFQSPEEESLYRWAVEASGDSVLEKAEFRKWSRKHHEKLLKWPEDIGGRGFANLVSGAYLKSVSKAVESRTAELRRVIEFRNYLNEFTLSSERSAEDVAMWKDYLIYAQMFGIADKVAKQFRTLYPDMFENLARENGMDPLTLLYCISWNNRMSAAYYSAALSSGGASGGFGGHTSLGGGGGFSGGGIGGGSR